MRLCSYVRRRTKEVGDREEHTRRRHKPNRTIQRSINLSHAPPVETPLIHFDASERSVPLQLTSCSSISSRMSWTDCSTVSIGITTLLLGGRLSCLVSVLPDIFSNCIKLVCIVKPSRGREERFSSIMMMTRYGENLSRQTNYTSSWEKNQVFACSQKLPMRMRWTARLQCDMNAASGSLPAIKHQGLHFCVEFRTYP